MSYRNRRRKIASIVEKIIHDGSAKFTIWEKTTKLVRTPKPFVYSFTKWAIYSEDIGNRVLSAREFVKKSLFSPIFVLKNSWSFSFNFCLQACSCMSLIKISIEFWKLNLSLWISLNFAQDLTKMYEIGENMNSNIYNLISVDIWDRKTRNNHIYVYVWSAID